MKEGQTSYNLEKNKLLGHYIKFKNKLWKSYFSQDGDQQVDRDMSIERDLTVGGQLYNTNFPAFKAIMTSGQTLTNGDYTTITFDSEEYDIGNNFSLTSEYFTAPVDGIYSFYTQVLFNSADSDEVDVNERIDIRLYNVTDATGMATGVLEAIANYPVNMYWRTHLYTELKLSAQDEIRVEIRNLVGTNIQTYTGTQDSYSYFTGHLVSALK